MRARVRWRRPFVFVPKLPAFERAGAGKLFMKRKAPTQGRGRRRGRSRSANVGARHFPTPHFIRENSFKISRSIFDLLKLALGNHQANFIGPVQLQLITLGDAGWFQALDRGA
jgi:hypothetical protein